MALATVLAFVAITIFVAFTTFPYVVVSKPFRQDPFPAGSVAVAHGGVIFTGVGDGRVLHDSTLAIESNDTTGRLMHYDTNTRQATVLLRNLGFPGGVAVSNDGSYVLVSETSLNKTTRFWVTGPKANTSETFMTNIIRPENIKRTILGKFWIAAMTVNHETMVPIRVRAEAIEKETTGVVIETTLLQPEYYGGVHVSEMHPVL
ncbi:Protein STRICTOSIDINE SYNTHASE-LIKE 12 [Linum perenne]